MTISPMRTLLVAAAVVILLLLFWPSPTPPPAKQAAATTPQAEMVAPSGYRLAGVAARGEASFAAFEDPNGHTVLYRVGQDVPGLGVLSRVQDRSAFITGDQGEVEFRIQPAATPTPDPRTRTPTARATSAPRRARTAAGSLPSGGRGRSAS